MIITPNQANNANNVGLPTMPANEPWGNAELTTEGVAAQTEAGHPLSISDFNQDAQGRLWRNVRGQKTYYAPEFFDQNGLYAGTGTDAAKAKMGVGESFFKQGQKYNWENGRWENPTNWANVIGTVAAGGVGAGIAAPVIAGALGGAGGASGGGLTSGFTSGLGANAGVGSVLTNPLVQGGIKTAIDAAQGNLSWKDALNFVPAIPGVKNIGGAITANPIAKGAINAGVQSGLNTAKTGTFNPKTFALDVAGGAVPGTSAALTTSPIARRGLTAGLDLGLNAAKTGTVNPTQAAVAAGRVLIPGTAMPTITRKSVDDGLSQGLNLLTPTGGGAPFGFAGLASADDGGDAVPVDVGSDVVFGDPTDPNDPAYNGGWPSNDNVGPPAEVDPGAPLPTNPTYGTGPGGVLLPLPSVTPSGDVQGRLPSINTPGQGSPLPSGGTPSGKVPAAGDPNTPPPAGGGILNDLTKILSSPVGNLLGGFLTGLGTSLATPHRQSFSGTAADPVKVMGDLGTGLKGLIGGFQDRYNQGVTLPDAYVDLRTPVFTGGGMVGPVGIVPKGDASIGRPAPTLLPGLLSGGLPGITPKATVPADTGTTATPAPVAKGPAPDVPTMATDPLAASDVNQPGTTPGQQYALTDPKQRALAALSLLGVS